MTTFSTVTADTVVDKIIKASTHLQANNNLLAVCEGDATAPKIAIDVSGQTAIETDETDTDKVLRPDGSGGVEWGSVTDLSYAASSSSDDDTVTVGTTGTWLCWGHGISGVDASAAVRHGMCFVTDGAITWQHSYVATPDATYNSHNTTDWSISSGDLSYNAGETATTIFALQVAG